MLACPVKVNAQTVDDSAEFTKPAKPGSEDTNPSIDNPGDKNETDINEGNKDQKSDDVKETKVDPKEDYKETDPVKREKNIKEYEEKLAAAREAALKELSDREGSDMISEEVGKFVERLYTVALGRKSDPGGKEKWVNDVKNGLTGDGLARGFLYSPEFLGKGTSNEEFLKVLYRTFFDREPDKDGFDTWMKALDSGADRKEVVDGFIGSQEYSNLCFSYRIDVGTGVKPTVKTTPTKEITAFAERLYSTCLGRDSDAEGLKYWSSRLANMEISGAEAAYGFFFGEEFKNKNTPDADYVTRLYRTFFDREPDQNGFYSWVGALRSGASREEVFNGFTNSPEWKQLCAKNGIVAGKETFSGDTRVITDPNKRTWIKETVDTGRRRTSPIYETYLRCWCNTCGKELNMYDPNDVYPELTHMFETMDEHGNGAHCGTSTTTGMVQIGTFQERILETHERCLETGEIRNRNTFWEEGGERTVRRTNLWEGR